MATDEISRTAAHPDHRQALAAEELARRASLTPPEREDTTQEILQSLCSIDAVARVLADDPEPGIDRDALLGVIMREARRAETLVEQLETAAAGGASFEHA